MNTLGILKPITALSLLAALSSGPVRAQECTIELRIDRVRFSQALEDHLTRALQRKGYVVNPAGPAAFKLDAETSCMKDGQQEANFDCGDEVGLFWTFSNLRSGQVKQYTRTYAWYFFPYSRALEDIHAFMKRVPRCPQEGQSK